MTFVPLVVYLPDIALQSAWPEYVPSVLNTMVYLGWSSAGIAPWKAGTFSVTPVSCQVLPVSALVPEPEHATRDVAIATSAATTRMDLRMWLLDLDGAASGTPKDVARLRLLTQPCP